MTTYNQHALRLREYLEERRRLLTRRSGRKRGATSVLSAFCRTPSSARERLHPAAQRTAAHLSRVAFCASFCVFFKHAHRCAPLRMNLLAHTHTASFSARWFYRRHRGSIMVHRGVVGHRATLRRAPWFSSRLIVNLSTWLDVLARLRIIAGAARRWREGIWVLPHWRIITLRIYFRRHRASCGAWRTLSTCFAHLPRVKSALLTKRIALPACVCSHALHRCSTPAPHHITRSALTCAHSASLCKAASACAHSLT